MGSRGGLHFTESYSEYRMQSYRPVALQKKGNLEIQVVGHCLLICSNLAKWKINIMAGGESHLKIYS